jgi:hypothetical protein
VTLIFKKNANIFAKNWRKLAGDSCWLDKGVEFDPSVKTIILSENTAICL